VGYPASRAPAAAFIYSFGANLTSGQAIYDNTAVFNADPPINTNLMYPGNSPQTYYNTNQEPEFAFGGDDINNWDPENSWGRFYN
jgi:hypothetical protein